MAVIAALLLIILLVIVVVWIQNQVARSRTARLRASAEMMGFHFLEEDGAQVLSRTAPFLLLVPGDIHEVRNLMQGQIDGIDVAVFDYQFSIVLGRYTQDWRQTVVRLASDDLDVPFFSLLPEDVHDEMIDRITDRDVRERLLGTASLQFPDHPIFNDRYHLQSLDRSRTQQILDDDLLNYYEAREVSTEGGNGQLIFYRFNKLVRPREIEVFIDEALRGFRIYADH